MVTEEERRSRIGLSERLRESAEHLSEAAMRSSLSRMYYSVFHIVVVLLGDEHKHATMISKLKGLDEVSGRQYEELFKLRVQADYEKDFVTEIGGIEELRIRFREWMREASSLHQRVRELISSKAGML